MNASELEKRSNGFVAGYDGIIKEKIDAIVRDVAAREDMLRNEVDISISSASSRARLERTRKIGYKEGYAAAKVELEASFLQKKDEEIAAMKQELELNHKGALDKITGEYKNKVEKANIELSELQQSIQRINSESLQNISARIRKIQEEYTASLSKYSDIIFQAAVLIAKKLSGFDMPKIAAKNLSIFIKQQLNILIGVPSIKVLVHTEVVDILNADSYFINNANVKIIAHDEMDMTDCKIEWENGLIRSDSKEKINKIEELIYDYLVKGKII